MKSKCNYKTLVMGLIFTLNFNFSIKPFAHHGAFSIPPDTKPPTSMIAPQPPAPAPASPPWLGRSIATSRLRMLEHSAFVDVQSEQENYQKHLFVHIGSSISYSDPLLEVGYKIILTFLFITLIDFNHIFSLLTCDKFKTNSLKSLMD